MVESNVALLTPDASETTKSCISESISPENAAQNVTFLRTQTESWLAVFFNVFGSVGRDGRGMVGDVISAWLAIAAEEVCDVQ